MPDCGGENPDNARFCLHCGRLSRRSSSADGTQVRDALLRSRGEFAEREETRCAVRGQRTLTPVGGDRRHEGFLEKFMGDAVLAVFGVPAPRGRRERAVRTAIEMQAVLSELNGGFAAEGKAAARDADRGGGRRGAGGSGAGERPAGQDADRRRGEHGGAPPGSRGAGRDRRRPAVYAATKQVIEYRELLLLDLKGKAASVIAWEALRIKAQASRRTAEPGDAGGDGRPRRGVRRLGADAPSECRRRVVPRSSRSWGPPASARQARAGAESATWRGSRSSCIGGEG